MIEMNENDYKIQDEVIKIAKKRNASPAQIAINWMLQNKQIGSVLIGL
jgi:aryl-alcohol dehydrogenase-like predicted oxidoreductase